MKSTIAVFLVILGLALLSAIVYFGIFVWAFKDFGMPSWPKSLYDKSFDGQVERLEQALLEVYSDNEDLSIQYTNGNYFDLHILKVKSKEDTIQFHYSATFCGSVMSWVQYGSRIDCNHSKISLYRIEINGSMAYDFNANKKEYEGIDPYLSLLEEVLISRVENKIDKYPDYYWAKNVNSDSTEIIVHLISKTDKSDTVSAYKFHERYNRNYGQTYTEKYYGDSIIRFEYDQAGHYLAHKSVIHSDSTVVQVY